MTAKNFVRYPKSQFTTVHITLASTTAETTLVAAAGTGVFWDLVGLIATDTDTVTSKIEIRDATAGSVVFELGMVGRNTELVPFTPQNPLPQTTANNNWTVKTTTAIATGYIIAIFMKRMA